MANFYTDNSDLQYYIDKGIDWAPLLELVEGDLDQSEWFDTPDDIVGFYREVLEMIGAFTAEEIAPHVAAIEREGTHIVDGEVRFPAKLDEIFEQIKALEIHGLSIPRELGGMNAPVLVYMITAELMARADTSIMAHHGFHAGIAMALLVYSISEGTTTFDPDSGEILSTRFADAIGEIVRGEAWGSMDITEPDAGSDMGALRAKAEQDDDGNWFVSGQKIFITSGHGKYHVVIARTEAAGEDAEGLDGLKGLSTFMVPAYVDNPDGTRTRYATVDRLEEKLGHHSSATCAVTFERAPAHLIGERGEGFKQMLLLMNNARIGVGFECIGICESALRLARAYAEERRAFGKSIDRHEMIADMMDEMETDIRALRAMAVTAAYHEEMAYRLQNWTRRANADELASQRFLRRANEHKAAARRITPLLKYRASEKAVEMARRCIQIHGGAGYTTEYGAEKLLRDAVVMPIYEGTSQIQSLMAMKDTLGGIIKNPQEFVRRIAQARWRSVRGRDANERRLGRIQALSLSAQQHLLTRTVGDKFRSVRGTPVTSWIGELSQSWDPKRDFAFAMLHAEHLAQLLADELMCELLLEQGRRHPERMEVFERFAERAEPRARYLADVIASTGERLLRSMGTEMASEGAAE